MVPWWVPTAIAVIGLLVALYAAHWARRSAKAAEAAQETSGRSAAASERSADAAVDSLNHSEAAAAAAARSASAAEEANELIRQGLETKEFESFVARITDYLNKNMWDKTEIQAMLDELKSQDQQRLALTRAYYGWHKKDRDLPTLLGSHGLAP